MKTLTQSHLENDNPIHNVVDVDTQKSMLPNSVRHVGNIMRTINGRTDRRFYALAVGNFWRPPADVEAAISRGSRKCRAVAS